MSRRVRRCPRHPTGCTKHGNRSKPKPRPRRAGEPVQLRGSHANLVAIRHGPGREQRRYMLRALWEAMPR